jgi:3,4-dihydroxyphthalate decarboxylase
VHAHPRAVLVAGLADLPLVPLFGSYDIPAALLAAGGVPVYPRSVLIRDLELASDMLAAMGHRPICMLRGHGLVAAGTTVSEALLHALALERLCAVALGVVGAGGSLEPIPADDLAQLPDLGSTLNVVTLWRHHLACLAADGRDLEPEELQPAAES